MDPVDNTTIAPRLRFRQENEVKLSYSARITEVEWERHAEAVKYMHDQRKTRREILETLDTEYEFRPSMAQLNMHMRKRKLRVYGGANAEAVAVVEDQVLQAAKPVAGYDEPMSSDSLPAQQKDGAFELQRMQRPRPNPKIRDTVLLDLPGDDQEKYPRFLERPPQASVTIPPDDLADIFTLNLDPMIPDEFEISENSTSLKPNTVFGNISRETDRDIEQSAWLIPDSSSDPNVARSEAVWDTEKAMVQFDPYHSVKSDQYAASWEVSTFSPISHQSGGSSLRAFRRFASEMARDKQLQRRDSPDSFHALTIISDDSWDFDLVTGIPSGYSSQSDRQPLEDVDWGACQRAIWDLFFSTLLLLRESHNRARELVRELKNMCDEVREDIRQSMQSDSESEE